MNPKKIHTKVDIAIAGGGIAGLTLGILLGKAGLKVSLIEKHPPSPLTETEESARTIALMNSSLNVIKATAIWKNIASFSTPMHTMRIMDASIPGKKVLEKSFAANDLNLEQFGFNIANSILRAALFEGIQNVSTVKRHIPAEFSSYELGENKITIHLDNNDIIEASLLIGADGRNSVVRAKAGIDAKHHDYGQAAITCIIDHTKPHNNTATEFHRPGGPFALVPLSGNRSAVVWVEKSERANELLRLKKEGLENILQKETHDVVGTVKLSSNPESWPLSSLKAEKLTAPRIALMAEAAHVMSPITAQGLNLSLRDVATLAETIIDAARAGLDIGGAQTLKTYEKRRALDVETRTFGVDVLNRIVSEEKSFIKNIRRAGLNTVSAIPPVKRFAMRQGLAPQMDLGRLARGERL